MQFLPEQDKMHHDKWVRKVLIGVCIALGTIMLFGLLVSCAVERDPTQQKAAYKHRKKVQRDLQIYVESGSPVKKSK